MGPISVARAGWSLRSGWPFQVGGMRIRRRCGCPSKAMPNMSQASRSYQFAAGQRSVTVVSDGRLAGERHFDANVRVALVGEQVIDDGEVARRLVLAMEALTLIDGGEIEEHAIWARYSCPEIVQDAVRHRACDPECRDPIVCRLRHERLRFEAFRELPRHGQ